MRVNKNRTPETAPKRWPVNRKDLSAMAIIAGGYALLELAGVTCPIKWLTGCSCAGCGLSRAWLSALSLNFPRAVDFHPLFWMPALMVVIWLLKEQLPNWLYRVLLMLGAGSMLALYVCRLLDSGDTIVVWRPWEGMLFRAAGKLETMLQDVDKYCLKG